METDRVLRTVAVAFADITGSTALYEREGNAAAADAVKARVAGMCDAVAVHDGVFVSANGDDVISWYAQPDDALAAMVAMLEATEAGGLEVHAGIQWGEVVLRDGDIFGDCVNTAARLCALAKPREVLAHHALWERLTPAAQATLSEVSPLRLKGKAEAARLYARLCGASGEATQVLDLGAARAEVKRSEAVIRFGESEWRITEGQSLTIGRSEDNAVVAAAATVSRRHATIALTNGLAEFSDHSSTGSYLMTRGQDEIAVLRRAVVMTGDGTISLGASHARGDAPRLHFSVSVAR